MTKATTAKTMRERSEAELKDLAIKSKRDYFDLSFKHATRNLEDTAALGKTRKERARALTVLGEKKKQAK